MAKRRPDKQLNKDDPDSDPEAEDSGEFQKADSSVLENRVIRKAKRRNPESSGSPSPLVNFAGFSTAPQGAPFSFFGKKDEPKPQPENKEPNSSDLAALKSLNVSCSNWIQQHLEKNPYVVLVPVFKDYAKHLATLNLDYSGVPSTSEPQPSFSAEPSATASSQPSKEEPPKFSFGLSNGTATSSATTPTFNFGTLDSSNATASAAKGSSSTSATSTGSFLTSGRTTESSVTSGTSAGSILTSGTTTGSFLTSGTTSGSFPTSGTTTGSFLTSGTTTGSFLSSGTTVGGSKSSETTAGGWLSGITSSTTPGGSTTSSAGSMTNTAPPSGAEAEADPSDEPPQFDFVPVGEEGAVFNIRCKVFLKKDGSFASVGVGTLYLKPLPGGKTQVITRADTAQGSVLLNLILTPDLPLQRTGKNNVLLVCVPTPDAKPPPVPVLIRVKSEEERDRLLGQLERLKEC